MQDDIGDSGHGPAYHFDDGDLPDLLERLFHLYALILSTREDEDRLRRLDEIGDRLDALSVRHRNLDEIAPAQSERHGEEEEQLERDLDDILEDLWALEEEIFGLYEDEGVNLKVLDFLPDQHPDLMDLKRRYTLQIVIEWIERQSDETYEDQVDELVEEAQAAVEFIQADFLEGVERADEQLRDREDAVLAHYFPELYDDDVG